MKKAKKKKKSGKVKKQKRIPRPHKITFSLNDDEKKMLMCHIQRNNISNRSAFIREILMRQLWNKVDTLQLSLFDDFTVI